MAPLYDEATQAAADAAATDIEKARAAREKREHVSKAEKRAARLHAAASRSPEERAAIAIRRILKPDFGPRLGRRFDLGKEAPQDVRLDNLGRGAHRLLVEDGYFMHGLTVRVAMIDGRCLITCVPLPPGEEEQSSPRDPIAGLTQVLPPSAP